MQVPSLRAPRGGDAKYMPRRHFPSAAGADRDFKAVDQPAGVLLLADALVKRFVHLQGRAFADLIGGWVVFVGLGHGGFLLLTNLKIKGLARELSPSDTPVRRVCRAHHCANAAIVWCAQHTQQINSESRASSRATTS